MSIEIKLTEILSKHLKFPDSANIQQRGIADKLEDACNTLIKEHFDNVTIASSRRSIEDISIGDAYLDHKSSDQALKFKMPNMISIDRLRKLDRPLIYNFIIYNSSKGEIIKTLAMDVYELNWDHLAIQNLGKGQLQIKNMEEFLKSPKTALSKEEWITKLKTEAIKFYENLKKKTDKNIQDWKNT